MCHLCVCFPFVLFQVRSRTSQGVVPWYSHRHHPSASVGRWTQAERIWDTDSIGIVKRNRKHHNQPMSGAKFAGTRGFCDSSAWFGVYFLHLFEKLLTYSSTENLKATKILFFEQIGTIFSKAAGFTYSHGFDSKTMGHHSKDTVDKKIRPTTSHHHLLRREHPVKMYDILSNLVIDATESVFLLGCRRVSVQPQTPERNSK